jgi:hypothetical protein
MKRNFRMYVESGVEEYGDMVGLFFEVDGVIVDELVEDNIENILIESYEIYNRNCEKFMFDSRFDRMEIDFKYMMGM